jgi:integrase
VQEDAVRLVARDGEAGVRLLGLELLEEVAVEAPEQRVAVVEDAEMPRVDVP